MRIREEAKRKVCWYLRVIVGNVVAEDGHTLLTQFGIANALKVVEHEAIVYDIHASKHTSLQPVRIMEMATSRLAELVHVGWASSSRISYEKWT